MYADIPMGEYAPKVRVAKGCVECEDEGHADYDEDLMLVIVRGRAWQSGLMCSEHRDSIDLQDCSVREPVIGDFI